MDKETTYRKTSSGSAAIAERDPALAPRQRSLLILVDGKRTVRELGKLGAALGDVDALLGSLLAQHFIEPVPQPAAAPAAAAPAPAFSLPQAQRQAVRKLTDLLGPGAQELCLKVEATSNAQQFRAALARIEPILREVVGPQRAAQFMGEMEHAGSA